MGMKTECEILYLCDGKRCEKCSGDCKHTSDISYAENKDDLVVKNSPVLEVIVMGDCF